MITFNEHQHRRELYISGGWNINTDDDLPHQPECDDLDSAQQPAELLLDRHGQALLCFLQQQGMDVDGGVLHRLLIQQCERKRRRVFGGVFKPVAGAAAIAKFRELRVFIGIAPRLLVS